MPAQPGTRGNTQTNFRDLAFWPVERVDHGSPSLTATVTTAVRALRVGGREIPVILPSGRDARLHTAAVIISVHTIGITALGFRVSVPQIVVAIVTAGLLDVILTYRTTQKLVWPASGMLTGSGVALILRLVGMGSGDYWSWTGWHWYALVAGGSLLTKYVIKYEDRHVFNPSNVGLVAAFLVVGSDVVEPLDFWWSPLNAPMLLAYLLIIGGGIAITRRLHLLEMAAAFWLVLASGLGVLAASGHCMIATWSPSPVCGQDFWAVLVTSPEVLVFVFFMITDPKTVPASRAGRLAFASTLGVATTLLIAPHTVEYGAKVGLLSSLAIWSLLRLAFERWFPLPAVERSGFAQLFDRVGRASPMTVFARGLVLGALLVVITTTVIVAGIPAREPAVPASPGPRAVDVSVDLSAYPEVEVDPSVDELAIGLDATSIDEITMVFAEDLALEAEAMRTVDGGLLGSADGGERLDEMQARLDEAIATGLRTAEEYAFDTLRLEAHEAVGQVSAGLVFIGEGMVDRVVYDTAGVELERSTEAFALEFVLRQLGGDRWLIVSVAPAAG